MTALSIVQDALTEIGETTERVTTLVGNNPASQQSLALLNRALQEVVQRTHWVGLTKEATFTTVNGVDEYAFEGDYSESISITMWDRSNNRPVIGPITPSEWQALEGFPIISALDKRFRLRKSDTSNDVVIVLFPVPEGTDDIFYEYTMNTPVVSSGAVLQRKFIADDDSMVPAIDEDLIQLVFKWKWKSAKGLPYAEEQLDGERSLARALATSGDKPIYSQDTGHRHHHINIPDGNFGG